MFSTCTKANGDAQTAREDRHCKVQYRRLVSLHSSRSFSLEFACCSNLPVVEFKSAGRGTLKFEKGLSCLCHSSGGRKCPGSRWFVLRAELCKCKFAAPTQNLSNSFSCVNPDTHDLVDSFAVWATQIEDCEEGSKIQGFTRGRNTLGSRTG